DIDAVEIYTPVFTHHTITLDSLDAGKHVLVEKPLAISVKAGLKMVEAAEKTGLVLGVAECLRYGFGIRETKWVIEQGYIGDLQMVFQGGVGGYWSPNKILAETPWRHRKLYGGGGVTLDLGVHLFNALSYLCGEVDEVMSIVKTFEEVRVTMDERGVITDRVKNEVDDSFFTLIRFKGGAVGFVFFSVAGRGESLEIPGWRAIYGSKGCIKGEVVVLDDGTRAKVKDLFDKEADEEVKEKFFPMGIKDPFALETLDFLKAIREGGEMETSGRVGLRDMALGYAMIESSILNRPVKPE
ncbi:MAG: Gfo/Idh/MocA family oxidoreductase, partial [Candidatus Bathyarchaeia archaeon]